MTEKHTLKQYNDFFFRVQTKALNISLTFKRTWSQKLHLCLCGLGNDIPRSIFALNFNQ